jgi:hypothetical protein
LITRYHAKYYAALLTQRSVGGEIDSLSQSLLNAAVDINPHQIEAALFAFKSPLTKGIILADEVGLGKTIEAGLVLCQYWAIGRRKIIVVCPASLRKQWSYELSGKFGIDNEILDAKTYNGHVRDGKHPFAQKRVIICSYNFASQKKDEILLFGFDLAIIDEAHKLRNVYKKGSKTAHNIRDAFLKTRKLLLTATPFQNSLMELFGLTTVIDENVFGDMRSFRSEYVNRANYKDLRSRIVPYYKRTLRKDVSEYINYTKRLPLTQKFQTTNAEQELYNQVSEFLRRDDLFSVPAQQQQLVTMIIRKILASSTYALIGTFQKILDRLAAMLAARKKEPVNFNDILDEDGLDLFDEEQDESEADFTSDEEEPEPEQPELYDTEDGIDIEALKAEISEIKGFLALARTIPKDTKSDALLQALDRGFEESVKNGAARKALIFTESKRTQTYLKDFLENNGFKHKIVLFNGNNNDEISSRIYDEWKKKNAYTGKMSGIKSADVRAAIIDYFQETAEVMIATEAAAEGLNMQFCSLVVNYDLPWNPQRIEQRIGRCHRYGQKSDVVVVNFVNTVNYADIRVFDLLNEKFHLFDAIFGASDEILGTTDGIDFEKRILSIYQRCRTTEEIDAAFEKLQSEMQNDINSRLSDIREQVLQNFDIEVQERLRLAKEKTRAFLSRHEYVFWELTKYVLGGKAVFDDQNHTFTLTQSFDDFRPGKYRLYSSEAEGEPYRLSHPLAQYCLAVANGLDVPAGTISVSPDKTSLNVVIPDSLKNKNGYLVLSSLRVSAFDTEEYCIFTAYAKDGTPLSQEECERLFLCSGIEGEPHPPSQGFTEKLKASAEQRRLSKLQDIDSRNLAYFKEEEERIFRWEKDLLSAVEQELDTVKRQIREYERLSRTATTMEEKLSAERKVDDLEREKRKKRHELSDREDEIGQKRRKLLSDLDSRMVKETQFSDIFTVEWNVV